MRRWVLGNLVELKTRNNIFLNISWAWVSGVKLDSFIRRARGGGEQRPTHLKLNIFLGQNLLALYLHEDNNIHINSNLIRLKYLFWVIWFHLREERIRFFLRKARISRRFSNDFLWWTAKKLLNWKGLLNCKKKLLKFSYLLKVFEDLQQLWEMCEKTAET